MNPLLPRFRRITTTGAFIPEIDGLRFIAILSVLFFHASGIVFSRLVPDTTALYPDPVFARLPPYFQRHAFFVRLTQHGHYGVQIFFAISGFILALPFARQHLLGANPLRYRDYLLRRLTRLELPYVLSLLLRSALWIALGAFPLHILLAHLAYSTVYLHGFRYGIPSTISTVAWSLEVEVQFYLLAPLLAEVFRLRRRWLRRSLLLAVLVGGAPLQHALIPNWESWVHGGRLANSLANFLQFFVAGMLVADLFLDGWTTIPRSRLWDLVCIPGWLLLFWLPLYPFQLIAPVLLPLLFLGAFKGTLVNAFVRHPLISTIGGMCYSIYLTHFTILSLAMKLPLRLRLAPNPQLAYAFLLAIPLAISVGAVYFLLIERPCMDREWPRKLAAWARNKGGRPAAVQAGG